MEIRIEDIGHIRDAAREFLQAIRGLEPAPRVVAFYGSMGAGKTTFIKALCEELGVTDVVTSPTFAIVNEYGAADSRAVFHFDFYRIRRLEEVYDMGYEDYFYRSDALCLIEWPDLIEDLLPGDALRVTIAEQPDGSRVVEY